MRQVLSIIILISTLFCGPAFAQEGQQPVALQVKMDTHLQSILEVLVTAVIGRMPSVSPQSNFVMAPTTQLDQGLISGSLNLKINDSAAAILLDSQAQVDVQLWQMDENVGIDIATQGKMSSDQLVNALNFWNQPLCPAEATSGCAAALLSSDEAALPASQKSAIALERFKGNLLLALTVPTAPEEETMTFGGAAPAPVEDSSGDSEEEAGIQLSPEQMQRLSEVIQSSFNVVTENGATALQLDMQQWGLIGSELSQTLPALGLLSSFSAVEIVVNDNEAVYTLSSQLKVPSFVVATYDAYLTEEQAKDNGNGLAGLNDLVKKLGPWAVGRCSTSEYQALCVEQLLNSCARDKGAVGMCVFQASAIQLGREADAAKDAIADGIGDATKAASDAFWSLFGQKPQ